jgi:hypothetical protein
MTTVYCPISDYWVHFFSNYDSQGYGGGILTLLHTAMILISFSKVPYLNLLTGLVYNTYHYC